MCSAIVERALCFGVEFSAFSSNIPAGDIPGSCVVFSMVEQSSSFSLFSWV